MRHHTDRPSIGITTYAPVLYQDTIDALIADTTHTKYPHLTSGRLDPPFVLHYGNIMRGTYGESWGVSLPLWLLPLSVLTIWGAWTWRAKLRGGKMRENNNAPTE